MLVLTLICAFPAINFLESKFLADSQQVYLSLSQPVCERNSRRSDDLRWILAPAQSLESDWGQLVPVILPAL